MSSPIDNFEEMHTHTARRLSRIGKSSICYNFRQSITTLDVTETDRTLLVDRYMGELDSMQSWISKLGFWRRFGSIFVLAGTVVTPALVSIQHYAMERLFWSVFGLSLGTGVVSSLLAMFSVESREVQAKMTYEMLISEGFQFLELSCAYTEFKSHRAAVSTFFTNIETLISDHNTKDLEEVKNNRLAQAQQTQPIPMRTTTMHVPVLSRAPSRAQSPRRQEPNGAISLEIKDVKENQGNG